MPERIAAYIMVGGRLPRSQLPDLLKAIREASITLDWGEPLFEPTTAEQLLKALRDRHIWLCDETAIWGEFPDLEKACRALKLGYTRHSDAGLEWDAELVEWRPRMAKPVVSIASNCGDATFILTREVKKALGRLKAGQITEATKLLRRLCPSVPRLPPFTIV